MFMRLFAKIRRLPLTRLTLCILKWRLMASIMVLDSTLSVIFPTAPYNALGVEKMREMSHRRRLDKW